jgi:hypothetical protein
LVSEIKKIIVKRNPGPGHPESGVQRRVQKHSWEAPGSSVALPERSGKVAGGFGRVCIRMRRDLAMIL